MSRFQTPPKVSLRDVRAAARATNRNEMITRERVERLEAFGGSMATLIDEMLRDIKRLDQLTIVLMNASLWVRLRWLLFGIEPPMPELPPVTNSEETESHE